ncbi:MAG: hypothetical protein HY775_03860 [Acidobacteria bacterium]|nr:hypothetical protein [Acidobacteriota bacterium]
MRAIPYVAAAVLVAGTAACSGGRAAGGDVSGSPRASQATRLSGAPAAQLFAGTKRGSDMADGAVASFCVRGRCARAAARPRRVLTTIPGGFLMFTIGVRPTAARVEVRPATGAGSSSALAPSTSMAFRAPEETGRYTVALVARWKDSEARWVFALLVAGQPR